jgi:hypothetical protein
VTRKLLIARRAHDPRLRFCLRNGGPSIQYNGCLTGFYARRLDDGDWREAPGSCCREKGNVMRSVRFSIAGLMALVLATAIALAAFRSASETWAGFVFLATLGAFCIALVGALCRAGAERGFWAGFAVFGFVYVNAAFNPSELWPELPTQDLLEVLARWYGATRPVSKLIGGRVVNVFVGNSNSGRAEPFFQIGHFLLAWLFGFPGAILGSRLFGAALDKSEPIAPGSQAAEEARPHIWWVFRLVCAISSLALVSSIAFAGAILPSKLWAGSAFLLTWFLIGLAALGALTGRGRRREPWLGATLLGAGFMTLAFGRLSYDPWPGPPTVAFLDEIRPWLPAAATGLRAEPASITAANARIHEALKRTVSMHFNDEAGLEDVLKSIKQATAGADGKGIPIYVDPLAISSVSYRVPPTVRNIELDGVPLRTTLRLCLDQNDLTFAVKDGVLLITEKDSIDNSLLFARADAYQVVGHCLLALIAAGLGGLVAPLVCDLARRQDRHRSSPSAG